MTGRSSSHLIPSIRSLISERTRRQCKPGNRADDFHLALVVECGGMRGVAAGGFLKALAASGSLHAFDTLHGSSSGACAAAYFLSEQIDDGLTMYYNDLCHRRVVNPLRIFSQPCMVDTDYIVDEVISNKRPLNTEKIISKPAVLNIVTTSLPSGLPVVHNNFTSRDDVLQALKATLRVPGPFECGVEIDGTRHLDGGIGAPIPIFSAIESGATHILAICTQRTDDYTLPNRFKYLEGLILQMLYGKNLRNAYIESGALTALGTKAPAIMDILMRPSTGCYCSWHTIEVDTLRKVVQEATMVAAAYLALDQ